jgi:hypothetical protein
MSLKIKPNWDARFRAIELSIESKDFKTAQEIIDRTIADAHAALVDPTFLVRELRRQRENIGGL